MQAVLRSVIRNLNLRVGQGGQPDHGVVVRSTRVGGCDDAQLLALARELSQAVPEQIESAGLDKRHHPADLVGTENLAVELALHIGRSFASEEQGATAEAGCRSDGFEVSLYVGIFAVCAVNNGRQDAFLSVNQVELRVIHIEFTAQCLDDRIDKICIFVGILVVGRSRKRHLDKVLEILAENMDSIILRNQLLAYIETPSVHLVQFQFEEAVDNLLVNASMNIRFRHNPFFLIILQPQLHILAEGRKRKASHLEMLFSPGNADNRDT